MTIKLRTLVTTSAMGALALALASPAMAQQAAAANDDEGGIEEIIVEAQRKAQNLQDVPLSVAAFTTDELGRVAAVSLRAINGLASNVVLEQVGLFPAAASFSMRGVGTSGVESANDPEVAVYINGVYQARNAIALSSTVDVEAVEVLRGPQGTLYGRNAYAGVVALRTKRPDLSGLSASASATIGNYGRQNFEFIGNVPLSTDKVGFRVAARTHNTDGWYRNDGIVDNVGTVDQTLKGKPVGKEQNLYIRPSLRFTPDDRWDINLTGEVFRERSRAYPALSLVGTTGLAAQGFPGTNPFGDPTRNIAADGTSPFDVGYSLENRPVNYDMVTLLGDVAYKADAGTIRLIVSRMKGDSEVWADTDGENINVFSSARWEDYKAFFSELNFVSDFSEKFDLVTGLTYLKDQYNTTQLSFTDFAAPFPATFSTLTINPGTTALINPAYINNEGERKAFAAYAQGEYHFTEALSFVLGGRYSYEKKFGYRGQNTTLTAAGIAPTADFSLHTFTNNPLIVFGPVEESWDNFSPRVGLNYKASDDLLFYTFWQRAYKSGGFNNNAADRTAFITPYGEQKVDTYEAGFKSEFMDRKARVNVNFFYSEFGNLQRTLVTPSPTAPSGVVTVTTNAADLRSYGVEFESVYQPVSDFKMFLNVGFTNAKYTDYCAPLAGLRTTQASPTGRAVCGPITTVLTATGATAGFLVPEDYSDLKPVRSPKWDVTGGFQKDFDLAGGSTIAINGSANYRSATWANLTNVPFSYRSPLFTVDASMEWTDKDERFSAMLWVRNLTNDVELLNVVPVAGQFAFAHPTDPRTYGLTLRANF
ncbi:MAG: TonB-dependent receptor [Alphaproteobacteria bacterium]|nr:TonB-dependent receptor [Alphaproteobacteria bacterium]